MRLLIKSLQKALKGAVDMSFNRVTVDGDTSTNDMVLLMANGKEKMMINENHPDFFIFQEALNQVCQDLAKDIARDGEGATKFINVVVQKQGTNRRLERWHSRLLSHPWLKPLSLEKIQIGDGLWQRLAGVVFQFNLKKLI